MKMRGAAQRMAFIQPHRLTHRNFRADEGLGEALLHSGSKASSTHTCTRQPEAVCTSTRQPLGPLTSCVLLFPTGGTGGGGGVGG